MSLRPGPRPRCLPGRPIGGCTRCTQEVPLPHIYERDIVQIQKEVWARIAQEEREGKRQPPIIRWAGGREALRG